MRLRELGQSYTDIGGLSLLSNSGDDGVQGDDFC